MTLMRELLKAHLDTRQPGEASEPVEDAAGQTLTTTPVHTRSLETIFGPVDVTRTGFYPGEVLIGGMAAGGDGCDQRVFRGGD